jgi:hypothetical protein
MPRHMSTSSTSRGVSLSRVETISSAITSSDLAAPARWSTAIGDFIPTAVALEHSQLENLLD